MTQQFSVVAEDAIEIDADFATEVFDGLSWVPKTLPCRYFYDGLGSELFEEITRLPEYYPARTEISILEAHARDIVAGIPDGGVLVEFGSGSSRKTEILLKASKRIAAYVPIDVSVTALDDAKRRLAIQFPALDVRPIEADFSRPLTYPADLAKRHKTGFFPGSTIGNQTPAEAVRLLSSMREALSGGRLIVGIDLKKDVDTLIRAYDDKSGVTAAFNLNLLTRINRELSGSFDVSSFQHRALYNREEGRIEMHIVSTKDQYVRILGRPIRFRKGETIHTENSYKYSVHQFQDLAKVAGWTARQVWLDARKLFSVHELVAEA
jgi:dimethylhistidine N-methyltransferase